MAGSIMDNIMTQTSNEDSNALSVLFDTKNYSRLKMISEIPASLIYVTTVLGVLQKRYKSKVLKDFDVEFLSRQKSRDRKGILELVEVMLGMRRLESGEDMGE
jgi:hypothetical protein